MEPYIGEIRPFGFGRVPTGWLLCDGRLLSISQNQALFALLGTCFGGDGRATFGIPDLRGRVPVGFSSTEPVGAMGGMENVTLTIADLAQHTHPISADSAAGTVAGPGTATASHMLAASPSGKPIYAPPSGQLTALNKASVSTAGGSQPHSNLQPFLVINFCIATTGLFPSRS